MNSLILLTTAIPRGDLHKKTIHLFYDKFIKYLDEYIIYHIINIDYPDKIKPLFSRDDTIGLFEQINFPNLKKYYIIPDNANFCKAYCNVIEKIYDEKIIKEEETIDKTIIWWMEDDWSIIRDYNFVPLFRFLDMKNTGLSFSDNSPLCSFRGGPVMNYGFFKNYFDIHKTIPIQSDPEYKVGKRIRSRLEFENDIGIFCIYLLEFYRDDINIKEYQYYYKRKFNNNIKFIYFIGFMENIEDDNIYIYEYENPNILSDISRQNIKKMCKLMTISSFKNQFNKNSLNYINFFPNIFEDAGRKFALENNLVKGENSYL